MFDTSDHVQDLIRAGSRSNSLLYRAEYNRVPAYRY